MHCFVTPCLLARLVGCLLHEPFDQLLDQFLDLREWICQDATGQSSEECASQIAALPLQEIGNHSPAPVRSWPTPQISLCKLQERKRRSIACLGGLGISLQSFHGPLTSGNSLCNTHVHSLLVEADRFGRYLVTDRTLDDSDNLAQRCEFGLTSFEALIRSFSLLMAGCGQLLQVLLIVQDCCCNNSQLLASLCDVGLCPFLLLLLPCQLGFLQLNLLGLLLK
mmetsp:Transcript_116050/g.374906  ORF Transcript_116050/g.374906 Transcript_116050/m.374906 type:complete len:223 (+) Transcript_116050:866-1534(+)